MTGFRAPRALSAIALLLASPAMLTPAFAQTAPVAAPVNVDAQRIAGLGDFVDGILAQQIATREVAGAVVTVVYDGKIQFSRGYGYADIAKDKLVDGDATLFRPGSVSKLFTWIALMQQVEAGRVDLNADINKYLDFKIPPFGNGKTPIRVRDLFAHTPGMSDLGGFFEEDFAKAKPYGEWIKQHMPARMWEAGKESSYSNYGSALAGYIAERAAGVPFHDLVEQRIFHPLGMHSTTFREPLQGKMAENMAKGYKLVDGQFVEKPFEIITSLAPAGSVSASGSDLGRFMIALMDEKKFAAAGILKPETLRQMYTTLFSNSPNLNGMAYGFIVQREANPRLLGHGGNTVDFHSDLVFSPETGFGFFVSTTGGVLSSPARTELRNAIIGRIFPQQRAAAWTGEKPALPFGAYRVNRRDYKATPNPKRDIIVADAGNGMITIETNGARVAYRQIGPRLFEAVTGTRIDGPFERVEFIGTPQAPKLAYDSSPYMIYDLVAQ